MKYLFETSNETQITANINAREDDINNSNENNGVRFATNAIRK